MIKTNLIGDLTCCIMESKNNRFIQVDGVNIKSEEDSIMNLDDVLLNIIRVNSQKSGVLSAYLARKKCYKICKQVTKRVDYKEYVERLLLDNYPGEFKKAEDGKRIVVLLYLTIPVLLLGAIFFFVGISELGYTNGFKRFMEYFVVAVVIWAISAIGIRRILFYGKRIRLTENEQV